MQEEIEKQRREREESIKKLEEQSKIYYEKKGSSEKYMPKKANRMNLYGSAGRSFSGYKKY